MPRLQWRSTILGWLKLISVWDAPSMIEVRNIEAGYGDVKILYGVSFEVPDGGLTALLGGNGSGKSTTLKALAGLVALSSGEIWLSGRRIDKLPAYMMTAHGLV